MHIGLASLKMVTTRANIQHSDVDAAEGVVEGVAFVLIAGVFLAIGAVVKPSFASFSLPS